MVSPDIYPYIADCTDVKQALDTLDKMYNPTKSVIFSRHKLNTCRQDLSENVDSYFQKLRSLARDCNFTAVDKITHENEAIREAFVAGLQSVDIRQRLLESTDHDLSSIHKLARSLEIAKAQARTYANPQPSYTVNAAYQDINSLSSSSSSQISMTDVSAAIPTPKWSCYNCGGNDYHRKANCPAKKGFCKNWHQRPLSGGL